MEALDEAKLGAEKSKARDLCDKEKGQKRAMKGQKKTKGNNKIRPRVRRGR